MKMKRNSTLMMNHNILLLKGMKVLKIKLCTMFKLLLEIVKNYIGSVKYVNGFCKGLEVFVSKDLSASNTRCIFE